MGKVNLELLLVLGAAAIIVISIMATHWSTCRFVWSAECMSAT